MSLGLFKILIASKSFGYGETEAALDELFGRYNCSAEFQSLAKIGSCLQQFDGMVIGTEEITEKGW